MSKGRLCNGITRLQFLPAFLLITAIYLENAHGITWWNPRSGQNKVFEWIDGGSSTNRFGNPEISDDLIQFKNTNFIASSSGNTETAYDRLQFDLKAKGDNLFKEISITELGSFSINDTGWVMVSGSITVVNLEYNNKIAADIKIDKGNKIFSESGTWNGTATITLPDQGWSYIRVIVNNTLAAQSNAGSTSMIRKNEYGETTDDGSVAISLVIPEPATLIIFGLGALLFPITRKRTYIAGLIIVVCILSFTSTSKAVEYESWDTPSGDFKYFTWSNGESQNQLFGQPTVDNGGTFIFNPDFIAFPDESQSDTMSFDIEAKDGFHITGVGVEESGFYELFDSGLVRVRGNLTITNLEDDSQIGSVNLASSTSYPEWSISSSISGFENLKKIRITVTNQVEAVPDIGSFAFIYTSYFAVPITIKPIPEPATIGLLMMGLTVFIGRKK